MPQLDNVSEALQQKWQPKFENWWLCGMLNLTNLSEGRGRDLKVESLPGSSLIPNICFLSMRYEEEGWTLSAFIPDSFVPQELLDYHKNGIESWVLSELKLTFLLKDISIMPNQLRILNEECLLFFLFSSLLIFIFIWQLT